MGTHVWSACIYHDLAGRLHHATGASIVLAIGYRKLGGQGFCLELYQGPESLSADPVEAATQVNAAMEKLILMHPEQYYWGYERYKPPKGQQVSKGNRDSIVDLTLVRTRAVTIFCLPTHFLISLNIFGHVVVRPGA